MESELTVSTILTALQEHDRRTGHRLEINLRADGSGSFCCSEQFIKFGSVAELEILLAGGTVVSSTGTASIGGRQCR